MEDTKKEQVNTEAKAPNTDAVQEEPKANTGHSREGMRRNTRGHGRGGNRGGGRGGRRGPSSRGGERFKPEFDQKVIDLRRVARVVAGGRRFSFRVGIVIGNRKGMVGVGLGKGGDTALAIEKAVRNARKHMVTVPLTDEKMIPHEVKAKYASAVVEIRPAPGKGLVAGSSIRSVLDLAGVTNVTAKVLSRSKNKLNNARVAVKALSKLPAHEASATKEAEHRNAKKKTA